MLATSLLTLSLIILLLLPHVLSQAALPAWPLAVKTPFFNAWYKGGNSSVPLSSSSPNNWSFHDMGWYCAIIVDGIAYRLMGAANEPSIEAAQQLLVELTPSRTIFALRAGPAFVNLTFFTPVTVRIQSTDFHKSWLLIGESAKRSGSTKHSVFISLFHCDLSRLLGTFHQNLLRYSFR